jgi:hypothetical protein
MNDKTGDFRLEDGGLKFKVDATFKTHFGG